MTGNRHDPRDAGMTLVEILIVASLIGLVTVVIASAAIVVLRVTPESSFRIDDARSTRGLQTWLIRDVASTPPQAMALIPTPITTGYVFSGTDPATVGATLCGGSTASLVIHMEWTEQSASYAVTYFIEGGRVTRQLCRDHSGSVRLTSGVSASPCSVTDPFSEPGPDTDTDPATVDSVEFCFQGVEADTGLNAGGGDTKNITLSVSSRNRTT